MAIMDVSLIPLERAVLCLDCNQVGANCHHCDCGSSAVYPVVKLLNRAQHTCADNPSLPCPACLGVPMAANWLAAAEA